MGFSAAPFRRTCHHPFLSANCRIASAPARKKMPRAHQLYQREGLDDHTFYPNVISTSLPQPVPPEAGQPSLPGPAR
jgi:hypothetical protein